MKRFVLKKKIDSSKMGKAIVHEIFSPAVITILLLIVAELILDLHECHMRH